MSPSAPERPPTFPQTLTSSGVRPQRLRFLHPQPRQDPGPSPSDIKDTEAPARQAGSSETRGRARPGPPVTPPAPACLCTCCPTHRGTVEQGALSYGVQRPLSHPLFSRPRVGCGVRGWALENDSHPGSSPRCAPLPQPSPRAWRRLHSPCWQRAPWKPGGQRHSWAEPGTQLPPLKQRPAPHSAVERGQEAREPTCQDPVPGGPSPHEAHPWVEVSGVEGTQTSPHPQTWEVTVPALLPWLTHCPHPVAACGQGSRTLWAVSHHSTS